MAWSKPGRALSNKLGEKSYINEVSGDLWITVNAYYDGINWRRIDTTKFAFGLQMQGTNNIPLEPVPGCTAWRAAPDNSPIIGDFMEYGGWELASAITGYRDFVIGGINFELDGSGSATGFGRITHFENSIHVTTNAFYDGSEWYRDDETLGATGIRINIDGTIDKLTVGPGTGAFTWNTQSLTSGAQSSPPAEIVNTMADLSTISKKKGYFAVVLNDDTNKTSQFVCIEGPNLQMSDTENLYPYGKILDDYYNSHPLTSFDHTIVKIGDEYGYAYGIVAHPKGSTVEVTTTIIKVLSDGATPTYINFDLLYVDPYSLTQTTAPGVPEIEFTSGAELVGPATYTVGPKWRKIGE